MSQSIIYREASKDDLLGVLRLYAQPDFYDGKLLSISEAEKIFDQIARYPDYKIYVAICEENIIGTFTLLIMDNLAHLGTPSAIIEDVAVDPNWQRQGIGKMMMRYALDLCSKKGCYKAALSSNLTRKRAHSFYESLGFEKHGHSFRVDFQKFDGAK
ncbi:MAG: GNAT family N-acetyltransferase [Methylococcaceae bacterium]|nr:GNAT family N-acetyltransferase [Methylococcaceae bacterium]